MSNIRILYSHRPAFVSFATGSARVAPSKREAAPLVYPAPWRSAAALVDHPSAAPPAGA